MQNAYVVTGSVVDDRTVKLDEPVPLARARVRLVLEPLGSGGSLSETIAAIRERQRARGYTPPSREEVDAAINAERERWDQ